MTYPNVLVMGYLRQTGQLTPEWQMKLEHAINTGYQRLLTFETRPEGGFDWYGRPPAKTILTAYGILEFSDMAKVYAVDPAVITRAVRVLESRQQADGSWKLDMPMHTWSQVGSDSLPLTAYVSWALHEAKQPNGASIAYLEKNLEKATDPYVLALIANALTLAKSPRAKEALEKLEATAVVEGDAAKWSTKAQSACYGTGDVASIETTALATLACMRGGKFTLADKGLTALVRAKDPKGGWKSTQSTVLAIKALLESEKSAKVQGEIPVVLRVNGKVVEKAFTPISKANYDVVQQADITKFLQAGENIVEVELPKDARASAQVCGRYYVPWDQVAVKEEKQPLDIQVAYDKTKLAKDELLTANVQLRYTGPGTFMVIADLGVPPGFVVVEEGLRQLVAQKVIDKYAVTGRQITLYFGAVKKDDVIQLSYGLRPRFPIVAKTPSSSCHEYYAPENRNDAKPQAIEVTER